MLIDAAQSAHTHGLPKLMQHPGGGTGAPQPGEAPPGGLLGQLRHEQIERMRGSQHGQQMRAPELGRAQSVTPTTGEIARTQIGHEVIRRIIAQPFQQTVGADGRQKQTHARTLTRTSPQNTPLVSAQPISFEPVAETFGTPSKSPNAKPIDAATKTVFRDDLQTAFEKFLQVYRNDLLNGPDLQAAFIRKFDSLCVA
jgi:hypothetical protein